MTDSSYDSLENELDRSSSPPAFCNRRHLGAETLQGSLDSILTFSDCDQDTDPEILQAQGDRVHRLEVPPLARHRARRLKPGVAYVSRGRGRRCSEPALTCTAQFGPCIPGTEDENSEDSRGESRKSGGEAAGLEASPSPSLSSISPVPTRSSLDSLDSLDSDVARETGRGLCRTGAQPPSTSATVSTPHTSGRHPEHSKCPQGSQVKEPLNWGTLKSCQSLHPNSWLKGRRLSLTQQEDKPGVSRTFLLLNYPPQKLNQSSRHVHLMVHKPELLSDNRLFLHN